MILGAQRDGQLDKPVQIVTARAIPLDPFDDWIKGLSV